MSTLYDDGHRRLQRQFDTVRLADRIEHTLLRSALSAEDREFVARQDMFFLATTDAHGRPNCSYKGGDPGFVRALDAHTLAFPNYDGNGMYLSLGNLSANPHVGLLFIDFCAPQRLRVNGIARIEPAEFVTPRYAEAQFVVIVSVREVFPNCGRYVHRYERIEHSKFVPRADVATPVPGWKRADWACDVLPADDPARR